MNQPRHDDEVMELDLPLVNDPTRAQSENVETLLSRLRSGRVVVPDYQRDADQWDLRKESLFIESVLNNLTVPAFFFAESDERIEVVDGQQRLSTIRKFADDGFALSDAEEMVYLTPQSVHYRGKHFSELPDRLKNVFNDFPLTIIYLPRNMELGTKLEIFRRINEGGTPLTAQDIRLAYYSESPSVTFIRLTGLFNDSPAAVRMREAGEERGVADPWLRDPEASELWRDWWSDKVKAKGQTPSEMFLWYLVCREHEALENLLGNPDQMKHLPISFRGSTEEALDVYCAQLRWTDEHGGVAVFGRYGEAQEEAFDGFSKWIKAMLSLSMTGLSVDKYKQMALLIGALTVRGTSPDDVDDDQWDALAEFVRTPRTAGNKHLEGGYPEQKGRWGGEKGQRAQCAATKAIVEAILAG